MRLLWIILLTAVLALFGKCPEVPAVLGEGLGLVFGGLAHVFAQPALLAAAFFGLVAFIAVRSRTAAKEA